MGVWGLNVCTPDPSDDGTLSLFPNTSPGVNDNSCLPPKNPWPPASREAVFLVAVPQIKEYESVDIHPNWPEGDSGVTWGVGFDAGQASEAEIRDLWKDLPKKDLDRLATAHGIHGSPARKKAEELADIKIPTDVSQRVFEKVELPRYYTSTLRTFPNADRLPAHTQAALLSLIYNRGDSMGKASVDKKGNHDPRFEMREMVDAVLALDLLEIANLLRTMKRVWKGKTIQKGMENRREKEALLVDFDINLYLNGFTCRAP